MFVRNVVILSFVLLSLWFRLAGIMEKDDIKISYPDSMVEGNNAK